VPGRRRFHPRPPQPSQTPNAPPAPPALFRLAAQLVAAGRVSLDQLLAYLSPDDAELSARFAAAAAAVAADVASYGKVDLTSNEGAAGGAPRGGAFSAAALDLNPARFDDLLMEHLGRPSGGGGKDGGKGGGGGPIQKLGLVEGLLAVGDWDAAKLLMQQLQVGDRGRGALGRGARVQGGCAVCTGGAQGFAACSTRGPHLNLQPLPSSPSC
jgi:hypothetical protein